MKMAHARESFAGRLVCRGEGTLLRIEGENSFVKNRGDGKEMRVHVDNTTIQNTVGFTEGDNIFSLR